MLIVRSESAGNASPAASLTTTAPGGITTLGFPLNVIAFALISAIPPLPSASAMCAAPTVSGSVPNSFDSSIRSSGPPSDTCTICRSVISAPPNAPLAFGRSTSAVAHVPTQWSGSGTGFAARAASGHTTAVNATIRRTRAQIEVIIVPTIIHAAPRPCKPVPRSVYNPPAPRYPVSHV